MLEETLLPVDESIVNSTIVLPKQVLGKNISIHSKINGFPDLDDVRIAILGLNELRNSFFNINKYDISEFIKEFYQLYPGNWKYKISDLGDIPNGDSVEDTYFVLKEVCQFLRQINIIPVLIGGSHDLTFPIYKSFENSNQWVNITSIDNMFDFSQNEKLISGRSYMSSIIMEKPSNLNSFSNLGYQSYLISQEELDLMDRLFFESVRLGEILDDNKIAEPYLRDSDIVTFDLKSLSQISSDNSINYYPNGFDSRTVCALSRYAGISDRVSVIGFFELPNSIIFHKLLAQIIWYFIEGFNYRFNEFPVLTGENFKKFIVTLSDRELIFHKSNKSERWWVEIKVENYLDNKTKTNSLLSCTHNDYIDACNDKLPERWLNATRRV
jgi:hypothetical protein